MENADSNIVAEASVPGRSLLFTSEPGVDLSGEPVDLRIADDRLICAGAGREWSFELRELRLREMFDQASAVVELPTARGILEIPGGWAREFLLPTMPTRRDPVERWARSARSLAAVGAIFAAFLTFCYFIALPEGAVYVSQRIPERVAQHFDKKILDFLDRGAFSPSRLSPAARERVLARFAALSAAEPGRSASAKLLFRDAGQKVNAFALPGGTIVVTDALVERHAEDIVVGVLGHEMGHVASRHGMRVLARSSAVGLFFALYVGDFSALAATWATRIDQLRYSRDNEREADEFSIAVMRANGVDPGKMAEFFRSVAKDRAIAPPVFFSTHPGDDERIARFERASVGASQAGGTK